MIGDDKDMYVNLEFEKNCYEWGYKTEEEIGCYVICNAMSKDEYKYVTNKDFTMPSFEIIKDYNIMHRVGENPEYMEYYGLTEDDFDSYGRYIGDK